MKLFGKIAGICREQGVRAFVCIVSQKLKNKLSEQQKYARYIRQERKRHRICANPVCAFDTLFAVIDVNAGIFTAIEEAKAPYLAFLEEGAFLSDNWQTLAGAYLARHPDCRFLYTDEDVLSPRRCRPVLKPDWSPDTYLSYDYIGGLMIMERTLAQTCAAQIFGKYRESFLYELGLRAAGSLKPQQIGHLDEVLYHRGAKKQEVPEERLIALKERILNERGLGFEKYDAHTGNKCADGGNGCIGSVRWNAQAHAADVVYMPKAEALVSIIVPSKDHPALLKQCIGSVEALTAYAAVEWIIVDNGSSAKNRAEYEKMISGTRYPCRYLYEPMEFNFSAMCNFGARAAKGEYLLFLNDDMELPAQWASMHGLTKETQARWLHTLVGQAAQPHTGAVGAKLLYPQSDQIQHLGVVNYTSGAAHLLWQASDRERQPYDRNLLTHNYAVVTGACLMVSADKYAQAGGFDESLAVTFNDVELCLKLLEAGYYNAVRSDVVLYHHESLSRGQDALDEKKLLRGLKERERLFDLHPAYIGVDPFYSRHLTQTRLDHTMDYPQRLVYGRAVKNRKTEDDHPAHGVSAVNRSSKIAARILRVRCEDELTVEGWAYRPGHASERVIVRLIDEDGNDSAYTTQAVYEPTLAKEQRRPEKLYFSAFILRLPAKDIQKGRYRIALQIGKDVCMLQQEICVS